MALNYHENDRLKQILALQDNYMQWYGALLRCALSPIAPENMRIQAPPPVLDALSEALRALCPTEKLAALNKRNTVLLACGNELLTALEGADPDEKQNQIFKFITQFEVFRQELTALRQSVFYKDRGFDEFSGLKNKERMFRDLNLEMERLARQGQPFAIAMARVDDYDDIKADEGEQAAQTALKKAAKGFIENLRPFDDAYYPAENEFVLCLKQTNLNGGMRAFQRFEDYLKDMQEKETNPETRALTMSCCMAEAVVGDDINELLANLREDVVTIQRAPGAVFSYQEISPLQRYVKSQ